MPEEFFGTSTSVSAKGSRSTRRGTTTLVFAEWCLRREAPRWPPGFVRLSLLIPVVSACCVAVWAWPHLRFPGAGTEAIRELLLLAAAVIVVGGIQFASKAVCWELSTEMRDIVRLTGLGAGTLLWTRTLSRWWTIGWSLVLLLPFASFAFTLGNVRSDQLAAGAFGLGMLAALVGGFGMLAGVLTADAKNPEKSASSATWLLLLIYGASFVIVPQLIYWGGYWLMDGNVPASVSLFSNRVGSWQPTISVINALRSPTLFSPTDAGYWLHLLTAIACSSLATLAMGFRFRSNLSSADPAMSDERALQQSSKSIAAKDERSCPSGLAVEDNEKRTSRRGHPRRRRPRCSDRPFFWKDVYILSDAGKRLNGWTLFYIAAAIGMLILIIGQPDYPNRDWTVVVANISIVVAILVLSVRFDALLTAEFRDRTWGTLMLLPVDPCDLLLSKLWAAMWEQRFAVLPVGLAQASLGYWGSSQMVVATAMAAVISFICCCLFCQMSCLNQLLGKAWWIGPCQILGLIAIIVASSILWGLTGLWPGFVLTVAFLIGIVIVIQVGFVNPVARNWVEA
jgi:hypothetical protein